jgi:hypothetical protein
MMMSGRPEQTHLFLFAETINPCDQWDVVVVNLLVKVSRMIVTQIGKHNIQYDAYL